MTVEAHSVAALAAPRIMLFNGGNNGGAWQVPYGMYMTPRDAIPVWNLLGRQGLIMNDEKPIIDTAYTEGHPGYHYHTGGHTDAPDWPRFAALSARFAYDYTAPEIFDMVPSKGVLWPANHEMVPITITPGSC